LSEQLQLRGDTSSNLAGFTPAARECVVDTTNNRVCVGDGSTAGGWPAAKLSEVVLPAATLNTLATGANGSLSKNGILEQFVSGLSGASVNASVQIPAGALVKAVGMRVTTAITGPTSFEIGVSGTLAMFGSGLGIAAGSTNEGMIAPNPFYSATTIILTGTGGSFSAGAVRLSIHYELFSPPTS
jgi:hypothetical protein